MKRIGIWCVFFSLVLIVSIPTHVTAMEYSGTFTSLARMWNIDRSYLDKDDLFRFRLYEYLSLYAHDFGKQDISIPLYARGVFDLGKEGESTGEFLYGYIDWKNPSKKLSIQTGRQLNFLTALPVFFDGIQVSYGVSDNYSVGVFGGINVFPGQDWSSDDFLFGLTSNYDGLKYTHVGVSYLQSYRETDPEHMAVGTDFSFSPNELFSARGHVYYEFLFDLFYDTAINVHGNYNGKFFYDFNYQRYVPSGFLPATSIFTVFSFNKVQEYDGLVEMDFNKKIRSFLAYTYRDFDVDNSKSTELGFKVFPGLRMMDYISASYKHEDGYAGKFQDVYFKTRFTLTKKLSLSARLTLYLYKDKAEDKVFLPAFSPDPKEVEYIFENDRRDSSFNVYLASKYYVSSRVSALVGIDYSRTPYLNHDVRGLIKFTYRFWSPVTGKGGDGK